MSESMDVRVSVPRFTAESGIRLVWEPGAKIQASELDGAISVKANRAGLISLASHLLTLAQEGTPPGLHIHLDQYNGLEEGSLELILEIE